MKFKRIIPSLLYRNGRLWKGTNFKDFIDVGDPASQTMVFDAQGADEIQLTNIDGPQGKKIPLDLIKKINTLCRVPIAVGGGITSVEEAMNLFNAGADKIIINTAAFKSPDLIKKSAEALGNQAICVAIDVRFENNQYYIYTHSGTKREDIPLKEALIKFQDLGAGEILLTSIDHEGTLKGYDLDLYRKFGPLVQVPFLVNGGCGRYQDIIDLDRMNLADGYVIGKMLCLRDYDVVRIKAYLTGKQVVTREA